MFWEHAFDMLIDARGDVWIAHPLLALALMTLLFLLITWLHEPRWISWRRLRPPKDRASAVRSWSGGGDVRGRRRWQRRAHVRVTQVQDARARAARVRPQQLLKAG
jgi:hypothetical protein